MAESTPDTGGGSDGGPGKRRIPAGLIGGLFLLLLKGKSLLSLLKLGKLATVFGSMFAFIWADAYLFGWRLAAGFAVSILIHEMGHVYVSWRKGLKTSAPMFIPFVGALILVRRFPDDPTTEAEMGAGGPAAGFLAAIGCSLVGWVTGDPFWMAVAYLGYSVNLFNLIPFPPLDGSHMAAVFSRGAWDFFLVGLLLWVIKVPSGMLWVILIVSFIFRLGRPEHGRHNLATRPARLRMVLVYLGLCIALGYGMERTASARALIRSESPVATARQEARERQAKTAQKPAPESKAAGEGARSGATAEEPAFTPHPVVVGIFLGLLWMLHAAGWLLAAFWLAKAAGEPLAPRRLGITGWMAGGLGAVLLLKALFPFPGGAAAQVGAFFAAMATGLVYAAYQAYHASGDPVRVPHYRLVWRCVTWAGGAALVVAYWAEKPWVVLGVATASLLFFGRRPWALPALAADTAMALGRFDLATGFLRRAVDGCPEAEARSDLEGKLAQAYLALGRGEAALEVLERAVETPAAAPADTMAGVLLRSRRALAYLRLERFPEALRECETILQAPPGDTLGAWRPLVVHSILAEAALYRGWADEARAQADRVLAAVPPGLGGVAKSLCVAARRVRVAALLELGDVDAAHETLKLALRHDVDAAGEAENAQLRARLDAHAGDFKAAARNAASALERLPESLPARYWRGWILGRAGNRSEAEAVLGSLAREFPREYWGRLASTALAAPA